MNHRANRGFGFVLASNDGSNLSSELLACYLLTTFVMITPLHILQETV